MISRLFYSVRYGVLFILATGTSVTAVSQELPGLVELEGRQYRGAQLYCLHEPLKTPRLGVVTKQRFKEINKKNFREIATRIAALNAHQAKAASGKIKRSIARERALLRALKQLRKRCRKGEFQLPAPAPTASVPPSIEPTPAPPIMARSVSQHGITWEFDKEYPTGQFVNGDSWVVGPVVITNINPGPIYDKIETEEYCRYHGSGDQIVRCANFPPPYLGVYNYSDFCLDYKCTYKTARFGYAVNPSGGGTHPFDTRAAGYTENGGSEDSGPPSLPYVLGPGSSLLSVISNPEEYGCESPPHQGWLNRIGECIGGFLKTAAVLTSVEAPPPADAFRPPYAGSEKPIFREGQLRTDLLPSLDLPSNAPAVQTVVKYFDRVWIDHKVGWSGQYIHPIDNLHSYGAGIAARVGIGALLILGKIEPSEKRDLLIHFVQVGIDLFGILKAGGGWPADGGHASGRKYPIIFAGYLLNDQEMMSVGLEYPAESNSFGEDCQTYYDDNPTSPAFHGITGFPRWGIRHCQNLSGTNLGYHSEASGYRLCCNSESWTGQVLAARILRLESLWNHQALFDYEDRYHRDVELGLYQRGYWGSGFSTQMWQMHRSSLSSCNNGVQDRCSVACSAPGSTDPPGPAPASYEFVGESGIDVGGTCGLN